MQDNSSKILEAYAGSFARIFWDQQLQASSLKDARSMRWEPMMICWCLYLRHLSTGAYETLRSSGALKLPSQRTLRDFTHFTQATSGFSSEVDRQLMDLASIGTCPEREKFVVILTLLTLSPNTEVTSFQGCRLGLDKLFWPIIPFGIIGRLSWCVHVLVSL